MHEHEERPGAVPQGRPRGYCVACKTKQTMNDATSVERGGGPAIEGSCAVCGAKMFILGAGTTVAVEVDLS